MGGDGRQLRLLILVPVKLELIRKNICQDLESHFFLISLKLKLITLYFLDYGVPFIELFVSCKALEFKKSIWWSAIKKKGVLGSPGRPLAASRACYSPAATI